MSHLPQSLLTNDHPKNSLGAALGNETTYRIKVNNLPTAAAVLEVGALLQSPREKTLSYLLCCR